MWPKIFDALKAVLKLQDTVDSHTTDIRNLQQEVRKLTTVVQVLTRDLEHLRETDAKEREMMALRLENVLLKFEKRLPTPRNEDNE